MTRQFADIVRNAFRRANGSPSRVLVVGDLMLDRYLWGEVDRISPEAPVPVVRVARNSERMGGSANVAANLAGLGVGVALAGYVGMDTEGQRLETMLVEASIRPLLTRTDGRPTTTKTRVIGGHQQMLRLDQEEHGAHLPVVEQALLEAVLNDMAYWLPSALILSDYAKGTLTPGLCRSLIAAAREQAIPVLVDPKGRDYGKYRGATALTPNQKEAAEACGATASDEAAILAGAEALRRDLDLAFLPITRGEHGITLIEATGVSHLPTTAKQVFDVSGAGDTVIATVTAGLLAGLNAIETCQLANLAAGIVVGKVGTVPLTRGELLHEIESLYASTQADKICDLERVRQLVETWRRDNQYVVFTNGCFDLLHSGHVTYLEKARKLGDRLVVGLNTDSSVRALKGPSRPVINEEDRARVLAALESVDAVVLFDEKTPIELIRDLRPDVLVKGDDYSEEQVIGAAEVKAWGGRVELVPVVPERSTSGILAKLGDTLDGA
jgi:D-beta-D-heptose 7-phosphate kinase / D-beta-D-heptose 1-phosphate adenosyltransferase